jgi:transcriptional regulator with XRE-family HTH domain
MSTKAPNPVDKYVGSRVRMRRIMLGMSQEKLGEALGLTFQQVQKYEKGTNRVAAGRLIRIAEILGVPVSFFLEGPDHNAARSNEQVNSALSFLKTAGAVRLLRAYNQIGPSEIRQALVELAEQVASREERLVSAKRRRARSA